MTAASNTVGADRMETLLAYLLFGEGTAVLSTLDPGHRIGRDGVSKELIDAGSCLRFNPMLPRRSYTFDATDRERIFTDDPVLLLNTPQDLLGRSAEIAFVTSGGVAKWTGLRRLNKAPRGVWCAKPRATFYEFHYREISPDGAATYSHRVAALSASGDPVPVVIVGSNGGPGPSESRQAVMAASVIEDAHRTNALTATVRSDRSAIVLPVALGDHADLFALRNAPLTQAGRRKAILHWVRRHLRHTTGATTSVKPHWRGIRELTLDGLSVQLQTN